MSSDYRPRGGGNSGGGGGGRRRRGGRGRNNSHGSHSSENRLSSNGSSSAPKKKGGFFSNLLGWFSGKKSKPESKPYRTSSPSSTSAGSRPVREREPREERAPRPERSTADIVPQEIVSPKLYVGNLAYEAAESDLFDLFSKVGAVKNVEIAMDRRTSRSKGFGFVEMETLETAKEAAEKLNRTDFLGRQIVVSGAKVDKRPINPREADSTSQEAGSNPDSTI